MPIDVEALYSNIEKDKESTVKGEKEGFVLNFGDNEHPRIVKIGKKEIQLNTEGRQLLEKLTSTSSLVMMTERLVAIAYNIEQENIEQPK